MKINITQWKFNTNNLDYNVECYQIINNVKAYLIMSQDTADALAGEYNTFVARGQICRYKGNKILIDNDLKFGEVEIR